MSPLVSGRTEYSASDRPAADSSFPPAPRSKSRTKFAVADMRIVSDRRSSQCRRSYLAAPSTAPPIGQQRTLRSRLPREVKVERSLRLQICVSFQIEEAHNVGARIWPHRVQRLIHLTKAEVCLHRLALRVHSKYIKAALLARQVLALARRRRHRQRPLHQRNFQALLRSHQLVIVDNHRIDNEVRLRLLRNRHVEREALPRRMQIG